MAPSIPANITKKEYKVTENKIAAIINKVIKMKNTMVLACIRYH